ncbi:DUF4145 domain-containing protein [Rathayibacter sp. ZW T2_19]|uniref:DUF4145 domain-containing protein n=1 Tax=Rathayibacter rubneri TaxID=2950106 RepID=A0A9X2DUP4_9MICO|nr:DUF4145 domain-containing protein [Rathayibacter rubneri]MCM6761405.1 DUF4145 domain-containing protein [Rathayibacter rubneri]
MLTGTCAFCANATHFTARAARIFSQQAVQGGYHFQLEVVATCDACGRFNAAAGLSARESYTQAPGTIFTGGEAIQRGESMEIESWSPPALLKADTEFLPEGVSGYVQEAHDAMSLGAHRAVLLLVRSVIEATAREKGIENGSLVQKINVLHSDGHLRTGTKDMAHVLRILGNDMAHGEIADVPTREDARDALTVMRFVLDDVYVADARRIDMLERRRPSE